MEKKVKQEKGSHSRFRYYLVIVFKSHVQKKKRGLTDCLNDKIWIEKHGINNYRDYRYAMDRLNKFRNNGLSSKNPRYWKEIPYHCGYYKVIDYKFYNVNKESMVSKKTVSNYVYKKRNVESVYP